MNTFILQLAKKCSTAVVALGLLVGSPTVARSQEFTEYDPESSYYYGTLTTKATTYYKHKVPANTFGVLTLKNSGGSSDFDIVAYADPEGSQQLGLGENTGTQTELIVVPPSTKSRYVYVGIVNYGEQTSEYRLYADYVSPVNKFALSFVKTAFTCGMEQGEVQNRTADRVFTSIFSLVEGNGLGGVAMDLVIDEITTQMREQFGYGCVGDFAVDWTVSIVSGFYKNYL